MADGQKMSRWGLTAMVVGGMVGAGIFSLPRTFANATGPLGALIAWVIAGTPIRSTRARHDERVDDLLTDWAAGTPGARA